MPSPPEGLDILKRGVRGLQIWQFRATWEHMSKTIMGECSRVQKWRSAIDLSHELCNPVVLVSFSQSPRLPLCETFGALHHLSIPVGWFKVKSVSEIGWNLLPPSLEEDVL